MKVELTPLGNNFNQVQVGQVTLWFSYKTCVAFKLPGDSPVVHENIWGPTTGRHLAQIDGHDKSGRVPAPIFDRALSQAMEKGK